MAIRVIGMVLAQIGPLTTGLEVVATAVGAGAVVFGAVAGVAFLGLRRPKREIEEGAAVGGYIGGAVGGLSVAIDLALRYAGLK